MSPSSPGSGHPLTEQVIEHIRRSIAERALRPGDRLPPERELAAQLGISRATLRTGIGYLAAIGILRIRTGVGTFGADGPPEIGSLSFQMMRAMHGFDTRQMFEARMLLECDLVALAAERGQPSDITAISEEVTEMYATSGSPDQFLIHDVLFHRAIARGSGNPILAGLMETISGALYEERRRSMQQRVNLRELADVHCEIYRAVRNRDAARASQLMKEHLETAAFAGQRAAPSKAASPGTAARP
jgi:GntR family transcriptional repressor for pyruvate dehydrogenase complex